MLHGFLILFHQGYPDKQYCGTGTETLVRLQLRPEIWASWGSGSPTLLSRLHTHRITLRLPKTDFKIAYTSHYTPTPQNWFQDCIHIAWRHSNLHFYSEDLSGNTTYILNSLKQQLEDTVLDCSLSFPLGDVQAILRVRLFHSFTV